MAFAGTGSSKTSSLSTSIALTSLTTFDAGLLGGVDPALFKANSIILDLDLEGVREAGMGVPDEGGDAGGGILGDAGGATLGDAGA